MRRRVPTSCLLVLIAACTADENDPLREIKPQEVRITQHRPDRAALTTQPIDITFSESLVGPSEVGIEVPAEDLLVLSPALSGRCWWTAPNQLRFIPEAPFADGARYRVDVRPSVVGAGKILVGATTFEFPTRMFTLRSIEVTPRPEVRTARVVLELSHAVRPAEASAAVSFTRAGGVLVPSRIVTAEASHLMTFLIGPMRGDFAGMQVDVHVDGSLRAISGGRPLEKTIVRPVSLAPESILQIEVIESFQIHERLGIRVRLNRTVDAPTIRSALSITPDLDVEVVARHHGFDILGHFEPNNRYTISLEGGIKSPDGFTLPARVTHPVTTSSLVPALRLTREAGPLELKSVNVGRVAVEVTKVWDDNVAHLLPYLDDDRRPTGDTLGPVVYRGVVETAGRTDTVVTSVVPFEDPYPRRPGLYLVDVVDTERAWVRGHSLIFDDGLTLTAKVGSSFVRAEVRSPATLRPVYGATIRVVSRANRTLGSVHTAPNGVAELSIDADPSDPPTWVIAHRDRSFAYLPLPHSDVLPGLRDISSLRGPAYVFGDRKSYHVGEIVKLGLIVRDDALRAPIGAAPSLEVKDPAGNFLEVHRRSRVIDGASIFEVPLLRTAREGHYDVRAVTPSGTTVGRHTFWVAANTAPRLVAETKVDPSVEGPRAPSFLVRGRYRLGDKAAAGLVLRTRCRYEEQPITSDVFDTFMFSRGRGRDLGDAVKGLELVEREVETRLDGDGSGVRFCPAVRAAGAAGPVRITLESSIIEPGGRAVKDEVSVMHQPTPHYVGVRRRPDAVPAPVGEDASLEVVVVGPNGEAMPNVALTATVRSLDGVAAPVDVQVTSASGPVGIPYVTREPGRHRVEVETIAGASTSMLFWVTPDEGSDVPAPGDQLVVVGRSGDHAPGDTATFLVWSPFRGRVDLTVERDRVLWRKRVDVDSLVSRVEVPVLPSFLPNVNVVARLTSGRRAVYAAAPLAVSTEKNHLDVQMALPPRATAGLPVTIRLTAPGTNRAHAIVWAVPERRLDPAVERPADPFERFAGRQPVSLSTHDMLALGGRRSELASKPSADRRHQMDWANGRSVWSSIVALDETAAVTLELPFVHGPVRFAAVVFEQDRFGAASQTIEVQDPLRLSVSTPRFLRPGDRLSVPIEVENGLDQRVTVDLNVEPSGPIDVDKRTFRTKLDSKATARVPIAVTVANRLGAARLSINGRAGTASTAVVRRFFIAPSRAETIASSAKTASRLDPLTLTLPTEFVLGSARLSLVIGPTPLYAHRAALDVVLEHSGQTSSGAMYEVLALLHAARLRPGSEARIRPALERLASSTGGRDARAATLYGLVMFEAVRAGYDVDRSAVERTQQRLYGIVSDPKMRASPLTRALAHFVLAMADQPERRLLIALAEAWTKPEATIEPPARAVLASAVMKAGMLTLGRKMLGDSLDVPPGIDALVLTALADAQPYHPVVRTMDEAIRKRAVDGRWSGSEENAFALAAIHKASRSAPESRPYWGTVLVDEEPFKRFNTKRPMVIDISLDQWRGRNVALDVTGAGEAHVGMVTRGVPIRTPAAKSAGLTIGRTRHAVTGEVLEGSVPFGELVVTALSVTCTNKMTCGRVVLDERMAAGLEVENAQLFGLSWLSRGAGRPRTAVHDDRLRYEIVLDEGETLSAYYSARAIAAGTFGAPPAVAHGLDNDQLVAVSASTQIVIDAIAD